MTDTVKVYVYDQDLKVRKQGNFPISKNGAQIEIVKGGEGHFMPALEKGSYLLMPKRSLFPPFTRTWEPVYFVRNRAKQCVNFETGEVYGIDDEAILEAANSEIIRNYGRQKQETPFIMYIIILMLLFIIANQLGVIA